MDVDRVYAYFCWPTFARLRLPRSADRLALRQENKTTSRLATANTAITLVVSHFSFVKLLILVISRPEPFSMPLSQEQHPRRVQHAVRSRAHCDGLLTRNVHVVVMRGQDGINSGVVTRESVRSHNLSMAHTGDEVGSKRAQVIAKCLIVFRKKRICSECS